MNQARTRSRWSRPTCSVYDGFDPTAHEMRGMFQYFVEHTYFGPERERRIAAANALVPGGFTGFADWARSHMKVT